MSQKEFDVYLASASPRRRELLAQIGVSYELVASDIPEVPQPGESPENFVLRMAVEKAQAAKGIIGQTQNIPVLAADTVVVLDNEIMGKPESRTHGLGMLQRLSGRSHLVMSAVALVSDKIEAKTSISQVSFRHLEKSELEAYWDTGEPHDKAGAYGIQGKAAIFIDRLEGSYSAVMGLPLFETAELLQSAGIRLLR